MTLCRSRFRDLIRLKTLFSSIFFLSFIRRCSNQRSYCLYCREQRKGEIRLQDTVQHSIAGGFSHIAARDKNTINQPNNPSCSRFANVYAANDCTFIKRSLFEQLSFVILICIIASVALQHKKVALVAEVTEVYPGVILTRLKRVQMMSLHKAWRIQLWWI